MNNSILIVDDSPNVHRLVGAFLADEPLSIQSALNGLDAIVMAEQQKPGLILLDIDMPEMDGFEVFRRLKAHPQTAAIPVVFLTASLLLDDRLKGLNIGALDYVSKPFKPAEFRARVRAALHLRNQSLPALTTQDQKTFDLLTTGEKYEPAN